MLFGHKDPLLHTSAHACAVTAYIALHPSRNASQNRLRALCQMQMGSCDCTKHAGDTTLGTQRWLLTYVL